MPYLLILFLSLVDLSIFLSKLKIALADSLFLQQE